MGLKLSGGPLGFCNGWASLPLPVVSLYVLPSRVVGFCAWWLSLPQTHIFQEEGIWGCQSFERLDLAWLSVTFHSLLLVRQPKAQSQRRQGNFTSPFMQHFRCPYSVKGSWCHLFFSSFLLDLDSAVTLMGRPRGSSGPRSFSSGTPTCWRNVLRSTHQTNPEVTECSKWSIVLLQTLDSD